jgi:hypothetical protein
MKRKQTATLLLKTRRPLNVIHGSARFQSSTERGAIPTSGRGGDTAQHPWPTLAMAHVTNELRTRPGGGAAQPVLDGDRRPESSRAVAVGQHWYSLCLADKCAGYFMIPATNGCTPRWSQPPSSLLWGWDDFFVPSLSGERSIGWYGITCVTSGEGPGLLDNRWGSSWMPATSGAPAESAHAFSEVTGWGGEWRGGRYLPRKPFGQRQGAWPWQLPGGKAALAAAAPHHPRGPLG